MMIRWGSTANAGSSHDDAHVALGISGALQGRRDVFCHPLVRNTKLDEHELGTAPKPPQVFTEREGLPCVGPECFEHGIPEEQPTIEHANPRVLER
jgi:hypothetical protein